MNLSEKEIELNKYTLETAHYWVRDSVSAKENEWNLLEKKNVPCPTVSVDEVISLANKIKSYLLQA